MHAFVTGGAGFIGSQLVGLLVREQHEVTVLAAPGESTRHLPPEVKTVTADLNDSATLRRVIPGCDHVFHLAARTDLNGKTPDDYATNTQGTQHLIDALADQPIKRLVFYSSMLASALPPDATPVDETYQRPPANAYGQSKLEAERLLAASDLPWTVIRPTFVYGPGERSTIFSLFQAIAARRFYLIGRPAPQSYVYVKNLIRATVDAALSPGTEQEVFLISDARPYTLHEFAAAAALALDKRLPPVSLPRPAAMAIAYPLAWFSALTGKAVPLFPSRVRTMTAAYVYSIDKARTLFGYEPPDDLEGFMCETIDEARGNQAI